MPRSLSEPTVVTPRPRAAVALWLLLALAVGYISMFHGLDSVGFLGPDEPRYAAIARDMAATGDWVTPRLNGEPWFEKPVLYYWVAGLGYLLIGDSETAARLPSALAALATTLALVWLAWQLHGAAAARVVAVLFPTTIAAIGMSRAASPDMLFAACVALAMVAAASVVLPPLARPSLLREAAFGAALGLAVLAKGPVGIILVGGSIGVWTLLVRQPRRLLPLLRPSSFVAAAVVALPWYTLCTIRNPEFFTEFIVYHNFQRFLTPVFQHQRPLWYFVPILLLGMVPWTPAVLAAVGNGVAAVKERTWTASPQLFLVCWALFPVIFFSLSKSKLPGYVLPSVPALALLLAFALAPQLRTDGAMTRWSLAGVGALLFGLAVVLAFPAALAQSVSGLKPEHTRPLAAVLGVGGALVAGLSMSKRSRPALVTATVVMTTFVWQLTSVVLPRLDASISSRSAARTVAELAGGTEPATYRLDRAWRYGLDYYLRRQLPEWDPDVHRASLVVTNNRGIRELESRGLRIDIVATVSDEVTVVTVARAGAAPEASSGTVPDAGRRRRMLSRAGR